MSCQDFLASEYAPVSPEAAAFHIIPAPLERSVSYGGGAARGPAALLAASQQLEAWESGRAPGESGFYTAPPVDCSGPVEAVLERIEAVARHALHCGAVPVLLGGEHTASLGALRALAADAKARGEPLGVVQFDAHADLRPHYEGDPYSHASVMYRAVADLGLPLVQFAVRDMSREEAQIRRRFGVTHYDAHFLARVGLPEKPLPEDFPRRIYVSFDVDGLDSSLMPATGTPSPGGLSWREAQFVLEKCAQGRQIAGLDVVELAPIPGLHHADFTAAKLTHLLMALALDGEVRDVS
ncbi:agmatinase family protein [Desulfovibrio sp. ZJ200]|uniref:agmatinase family protein n=1 Tax=Desulfovibrio sp. ZJ200 TaxID=2709792 RepID=UPI0013EDE91B|nr:agmatinase family protein [Desulfovibrio sp. ZJ200]